MKRKFVLAAALAGACFFVAGCEDDADVTALGNQEAPITAADTKAECNSTCTSTCEKGDVAAAETKAKTGCCASKGEVAAAETKAKTGCCAKKAAQDN